MNEHLMIVFYDLLLHDDTFSMTDTHDARRQRLCSLVHCIPGRAAIGSRENIDFSSRHAPEQLREAFSRAIIQRWEGLVLKGRDEPYYSLSGSNRFIKLKKDYIQGLGDTADLAIVGGRRDPIDEQELGVGKLRWTSFYIGCLENKDRVCRLNVKPIFRIIDQVDRHGIAKEDILFLNRLGYFQETPFSLSTPELDVRLERGKLPWPTDLFKRPFVADVMGAGFDKPANTNYYALRFPRVQKIHGDRTFKDTVGFGELQELARKSMEPSHEIEIEIENRNWLEKLEQTCSNPDYLINSVDRTIRSTGGLEKRGSEEQESGKIQKDHSPLHDRFFQTLKRKPLSEDCQPSVKRARVSLNTSTNAEVMEQFPATVKCTSLSSFHEESSVTLSANSSVTEHATDRSQVTADNEGV